MNLKRTLSALLAVVLDEAANNSDFRKRMEAVLDPPAPVAKADPSRSDGQKSKEHRKGGRRASAVLDPVELIALGEAVLRVRLGKLDLEQLLDVVAQFGMDPGKLVMKWKDRDRIIDRIVEISSARATKGDSFRKE